MDKNWSRRKFSKAAATAQLLLGSGLLNLTGGCSDSTPDSTEILDPDQQRVLKLAMDEIIPAADPMPAVSETGAVEYVMEVLNEYPDLITPMQQILGQIEEHSREKMNGNFKSLGKVQRIEVLRSYETAKPDLFSVLVNFTYESYYTNEKVWELIGYEPYPTISSGPVMDPFDETLLKRVKSLGKLYVDPDANG